MLPEQLLITSPHLINTIGAVPDLLPDLVEACYVYDAENPITMIEASNAVVYAKKAALQMLFDRGMFCVADDVSSDPLYHELEMFFTGIQDSIETGSYDRIDQTIAKLEWLNILFGTDQDEFSNPEKTNFGIPNQTHTMQ